MANNISAIDSLKEEAVRVQNGTISVFPQFSNEEVVLSISELVPKFNGCYSTNNSTVCFVSENEVFVTPQTRSVMRTLRSAGFSKENFYVPFSNWDYPKSERFKWRALCERATKSYGEDFAEDCANYCDEHHIGTISDETLQNCFEMPSTGVGVKYHGYDDCYYPIIISNCFDFTAVHNIGHYCTNNGKVVFVYRNGKTYVTKGYKIVTELRSAGYTESNLFVPFSNGEQIKDSTLRARWESIAK